MGEAAQGEVSSGEPLANRCRARGFRAFDYIRNGGLQLPPSPHLLWLQKPLHTKLLSPHPTTGLLLSSPPTSPPSTHGHTHPRPLTFFPWIPRAPRLTNLMQLVHPFILTTSNRAPTLTRAASSQAHPESTIPDRDPLLSIPPLLTRGEMQILLPSGMFSCAPSWHLLLTVHAPPKRAPDPAHNHHLTWVSTTLGAFFLTPG